MINNNNFKGNHNFNDNNFEMFFSQNNFNNDNLNNFNNNFNNFYNNNNDFNNNNNFAPFNNFNNSNQNVPYNQPNMNNNFGFNNNMINTGQFNETMPKNNMINNNVNNFNNVNIPINNLQAFTFDNIELNPYNNINNDKEIFDGSKELSQLFTGIELKYPHLIRIVNMGQISYMNSTIQCLSNIKELSDFLINNFSSFNYTSNLLTTAYTNLLFELLINKDNKKFMEPTEFKK